MKSLTVRNKNGAIDEIVGTDIHLEQIDKWIWCLEFKVKGEPKIFYIQSVNGKAPIEIKAADTPQPA